MQSIMAETLTLIDNSVIAAQKTINHETLGSELTESLVPADSFSFRRVEFHIAKKTFTSGGDDGGFRVETLNSTNKTHGDKQIGSESVGGGYSGKKRDASELENGLDQELSFGNTFRRIGAGLENLGNTCFLNSVLQCLTYTEPLAAYLQSGKHQVTCRKSGFCALCAIQKHVSRALQLSGKSLAPKDLVSNLRCISRTFRNSRQEDAHEYMVNLLESMHKCCLPNGEPSESQSAYDKSLVHKIFGGRLRSQVKCMQCNYCSNKFDPFLDLSLEILKADTLYKALANFTAKEQLDGGAKQYQCQQCKQKVRALKQLTVYKAPNVLTLHLKRFGSHMSGQKIDKKVHFGPTLDLKQFVTGPYDGDLKYTLYGVLVHAGWSTHSGHYYCFVRTSSGMWYSLDDTRVFQVSEKKVFEQKAYMLFYFKDTKKFPSKKTTDVNQKEKIVMNGVPREAQMKTGPSNQSLNAQTPLIKTADAAHQKENIVMNGTPNVPSAPREAQMNTVLSNGSLDAHMPLATVGTKRSCSSPDAPKETQSNTAVSNGSLNNRKSLVSVKTLDASGAPKEAQMETGLSDGSLNAQESLATVGIVRSSIPVAPQETQTNTVLGNRSFNDHKSMVSVRTLDGSGAPKEAQMKTGLIDGSLNAHKSLADVGIEENGFGPVARKETQTDSNLSNGSLSGPNSSAITGTVIKGFSTGAPEPEHIQTKQISVSKSISEPSETENHTKEIGGCESYGGNSGGDDCMEATPLLKTSDLPKMGSSTEKAFMGKPRKKVKNLLKCRFVSMKFSLNVLMGTSLNQRKKKKHKRNKRVKNLAQENLVNEGSSSSVKIEAEEMTKLVDNGFKERVDEDGAALATSENNSGNQLNPKDSNQLENRRRSLSQKDLLHMLTTGVDDRTVPRWDEDEPSPSQIFREERNHLAIGYIGDEWDGEYDRGKRKKVKISKTEFDGKNSFQDIANARLKSVEEKPNLSKTQPMMMKKKNKHSKQSRSGNGPYRI